MKLLAVGCLHGSVPRRLLSAVKKEKPDALLYCGDLCEVDVLRDIEFGNFDSIEVIEALFNPKKYRKLVEKSAGSMQVPLRFFGRLGISVFLVYGNNDYLDRDLARMGIGTKGLESSLAKNVRLVKDRVVKFDGICIAGFPGYKGVHEKYGRKSYKKRLNKLVSRIEHPERTIFITHDVPYRKFDLVRWKKSPAFGRHAGEKLFNRMLSKTRLLTFICAHMHEHQGIDSLYGTPIITTGYGREGRFVLLEIENAKVSKVKFFR